MHNFQSQRIKDHCGCKQENHQLLRCNSGLKNRSTSTILVDSHSNHPRSITSNIPKAINKRLCELSSSESTFNTASSDYQQALEKSGYNHRLAYNPTNATQHNNKKRRRTITWFNPPYSVNVSTNIGRAFLNITNSIFTPMHKLHKIFNRNTLKISYSCMRNIGSIIKAHNKAALETATPTTRCNCRNADTCPLPGKCTTSCIIYQATVTRADNGNKQTYIGLSEPQFKLRYANHLATFRSSNKRNATELSKYIWQLKDSNIDHDIRWKIAKQTRAYDNSTGKCSLCIWEKFFILYRPSQPK